MRRFINLNAKEVKLFVLEGSWNNIPLSMQELLRSQGLDGIQPRRLAGGVETEEYPHNGGNNYTEEYGIIGDGEVPLGKYGYTV